MTSSGPHAPKEYVRAPSPQSRGPLPESSLDSACPCCCCCCCASLAADADPNKWHARARVEEYRAKRNFSAKVHVNDARNETRVQTRFIPGVSPRALCFIRDGLSHAVFSFCVSRPESFVSLQTLRSRFSSVSLLR